MSVIRTFKHGVLVGFVIDGIPQPTPGNAETVKPQWPTWAKALKKLATPEDKGIGDVVARMIGDEASAKFKAWHIATFGKPCNCTGRRERWNRQYPL